MNFQFAQIVVVDGNQVGVMVNKYGQDNYEVYVRNDGRVKSYKTKDIDLFRGVGFTVPTDRGF